MAYTKQEELELWKRWKAGDSKAQNKLIKSLDPLLQQQVNRYFHPNIPRSALEMESKKLALDAFKTYDPNKSALNTHVTNHQKHLQRYVLNFVNLGKIPENRALAVGKFQKIKQNLMEDLGREPTLVELADELKWPTQEVERMESELRKDLALTAGDEEEGFFEHVLHETEDIPEALEFVYHEATPEDKLILEYYWGLGGKQQIGPNIKEISFKIGKPDFYVRRRIKKLGDKLNEIRGIATI